MNNTEDAPGDDLRQQAAKETANAIARMKNGAASVDGSDISSAIKHIAAATQKPVNLPRLPTMDVTQPDGSVRTIPMPATWHNPRFRGQTEVGRLPHYLDPNFRTYAQSIREFLGRLLRRVLGWFGR